MNAKRTIAVVIVAAACLAGCGSSDAPPEDASPVVLKDVGHDDLKQVTLTPGAAERLAVETAKVGPGSTSGRLTIPYPAVVYAGDGSTWTYTTVGQYSYVRAPITVVSIVGEVATLSTGPAAGTEVVVVGAPELLGAELEISGEE